MSGARAVTCVREHYWLLSLGFLCALPLLVPFTLSRALAGGKPKKKDSAGVAAVVAGKAGKQAEEIVLAMDKEAGGFTGTAFLSKGDTIILYKSYGLADAAANKPIATDALWDWASISKQFTAAAILRLEMERKLSIDDSITKYYPDAPADKKPVTLRHLLHHTSGIQVGFESGKEPDANNRDHTVSAFLKLPFVAKPGEKFEYNNMAYAVLAAVVETVSKKPFEEYCVNTLFKPAGMNDACFIGWKDLDLERVPKDDRGKGVPFAYGTRLSWGYRGMGGAVASAHEMMLWDRALRGDKILNAAAKARYYEVDKDDYACGWKVRKMGKDAQYSHTGKVGHTTSVYLRDSNENVVVALAFGYDTTSDIEGIAQKLANIARTAN